MATATTSRRLSQRLVRATRLRSWRKSVDGHRRVGKGGALHPTRMIDSRAPCPPSASIPGVPLLVGTAHESLSLLETPRLRLCPAYKRYKGRLRSHRLGGAADHAALRIVANCGEQKEHHRRAAEHQGGERLHQAVKAKADHLCRVREPGEHPHPGAGLRAAMA